MAFKAKHSEDLSSHDSIPWAQEPSVDLSSLGRTSAVVIIVLCVGSLFEGVVLYPQIVSPPFLLYIFIILIPSL